MLTGGPRGSPDSSDPMVDGVRHPLDSGCAGYILYSAYPVLMGRCGFREILCKAAVAVRRAVLPWVLLYAGLCPAALIFLFRLAVCLPSYAWLMSIVFYKESALFLYRLYWLHQCGIPHRTCRFHCCLAAHQRTRKKDSAEPSFPILWTPPHPPGESAAAGHFGCRGGQGYRQLVSGADCLSPLRYIDWVLCVRAEIVCVSVDFAGHWSFVFHWW